MTALSMNRVYLPTGQRFAFQAASPAGGLRAAPRAARLSPAVRPDRRSQNGIGFSAAAALVPVGLTAGLIVWFGTYFVPAALTFAHTIG